MKVVIRYIIIIILTITLLQDNRKKIKLYENRFPKEIIILKKIYNNTQIRFYNNDNNNIILYVNKLYRCIADNRYGH